MKEHAKFMSKKDVENAVKKAMVETGTPQEKVDKTFSLIVNKGCLICSKDINCFGAFMPNDSHEYGAPKGKIRTFWYGLCVKCFEHPNRTELTDKEFSEYAQSLKELH